MPKGPQGQKRKADVIGNAVLIGKIATGEESETVTVPSVVVRVLWMTRLRRRA